MPKTLLATKLHIPRFRRDLVRRPRLLERLDAGFQGKLTLVSAPAGYGKTTLVSDWIRSRGGVTPPPRAAWLSLDEADNDLTRFLTYLIAALQRIDESIGADLQAVVAESQAPPGETLLARLVNDIAAAAGAPSRGSGRGFLLVLDDYHVITSQPVHDALNFLLEHLSEAMHLLVAGRSDPPLPVSRLRVQGEITEIRTPELRFTTEEAAAFLNDLMGLGLSRAHVAALEARTEGWIASLQLAALSLQGRPDKHEFVAAFSGSHRYVIDYLVDEVLSRQPEEIQAFLHQTSILDRFCAPLCDAVWGGGPGTDGEGESSTFHHPSPQSQAVLEQLERANLFLIPLDDERRWYRYHHLFAGFLQQRLRQREQELVPELHLRASQWYEAEGLMEEAIQHALLAGDMGRATRLVDQIAASLVVRRQPNSLLKLTSRLPSDLCQDYPMLCVWQAWALLFAGQLDEVEPVLLVAEANRAKAPELAIPAYATTIRAYVANQMGNVPQAIELTQQALAQLPEASSDRVTLIFRGAAVIWLGVNRRLLGDLDRAKELFVQAATLNQQAGNIYGALSALEQSADLAMIEGRLHQAVEVFRQGLQVARKWSEQEGIGRAALPAALGLHLGLGTALYERNDLPGAARHIQQAVALGELEGAWWRVHGYKMLAYLKHAGTDHEAAYDLLRQACAIRDSVLVRQTNLSAQPGLEQLRILLSRARPDMGHLLLEAAQRMESLGLEESHAASRLDFASPAYYARESEYADLARVLVATGRAGEAIPLIEALLEAAWSMGRRGDALRYLVLQATACDAQGDTGSALSSLDQALALAEPEGYVRVFVDEGEPMAELLQAVSRQPSAVSRAYIERLLAAFGEATEGEAEAAPSSARIEPLTERELEVLRLMAAGLKHREVAEGLVISLNTVRHHTRNIYGKLGVHRRVQAIAKAKDLNLL